MNSPLRYCAQSKSMSKKEVAEVRHVLLPAAKKFFSHKKARKSQNRNGSFCVFGAFLWLLLRVTS